MTTGVVIAPPAQIPRRLTLTISKSGSKLPRSALELTGFLARPALDDNFGFGEKFDGVAALAVKDAEEAFFPATERKIGHGSSHADINADVPCGRFITEFARGGTASGEVGRLVPVGAAAEKHHGFVDGIRMNQTEHGTEDFRIGELAVGGQTVQNRGSDEISGFVFRDFSVASIEDGLCPFADTRGNQGFNALFTFLGDHWTHLNTGVEAVANANGRGGVGNGIAEGFLGFADGDSNGNGKAALAGATKRAVADDLRGEFHVRVGQYDDMIFCATLTLHAFAAGSGSCVNMPGNGRRADKADGTDLRMVAEGIDHFFPTVDEVHDSFRQASLFQKLESAVHGEGNAL